jgi:hypothetical protein
MLAIALDDCVGNLAEKLEHRNTLDTPEMRKSSVSKLLGLRRKYHTQ